MFCVIFYVQMTIVNNRSDISDLNSKLNQEQQKGERQLAFNKQQAEQMRDLQRELKVRLQPHMNDTYSCTIG